MRVEEEKLELTIFDDPFPITIINNFYNDYELSLIWEELNFLTKPGKLVPPDGYGGIPDYTEAKALQLDSLYKNRNISNILTVNRKLFKSGVLKEFSKIHGCCSIADRSNWDITKVRYYHDGESYDPHVDASMQFLAFSYFHKEPKKFDGGKLIFPDYGLDLPCNNNSMIIFPGWVRHGVEKVSILNSDYYDGYGRYAITSFFGCQDRSIRNNNKKNKKKVCCHSGCSDCPFEEGLDKSVKTL